MLLFHPLFYLEMIVTLLPLLWKREQDSVQDERGCDGVQQEDGTRGRRRNDEMGRMTKVQEGEGSERLQERRDIN